MNIYEDEDDDEFIPRPYEEGCWEWSEDANQLIFIKKTTYNESNQSKINMNANNIRKMEFKFEIDLMDEQWFKKRYQRPFNENDVVMLQDVKDIVFFIAPKPILTRDVINVLHLFAMDRFLRALIFYCQYYLQVSSEMADRCSQLKCKIKTMRSQQIEDTYQDNLRDLRLLLAKEYGALLLGAGEYCKYHHMGADKTYSLTKKDSILFETILRISTHIVWIALGRKSFKKIEMEIQRFFKSNTYNITKHILKSDFENEISSAENAVLFGGCKHKEKRMALRSPLINEITCAKESIDYRLLGLGAIEYPTLNARLLYFQHVLSSPETALSDLGISLGIIGLRRERFDSMLREIKKPATSSSTSVRKTTSRKSSSARSSLFKSNKFAFESMTLYRDITLPDKRAETSDELPDSFPGKILPKSISKNEQRLKWLRLAAVAKRKETMKRKVRIKTY